MTWPREYARQIIAMRTREERNAASEATRQNLARKELAWLRRGLFHQDAPLDVVCLVSCGVLAGAGPVGRQAAQHVGERIGVGRRRACARSSGAARRPA